MENYPQVGTYQHPVYNLPVRVFASQEFDNSQVIHRERRDPSSLIVGELPLSPRFGFCSVKRAQIEQTVDDE